MAEPPTSTHSEGRMGKLIYAINTSLDAFTEDATGSFGPPRGPRRTRMDVADKPQTQSPIADEAYGSVIVFRDPDNIQLELFCPPGA